ncbi:unnamed protein product [Allacma fusca]|uniref:Uncharacterized protein n=1 Tax=Allacma fusca TaxID=39272 RepID=A0A8J2P6W8_9HEXA|nr:unnamed protein product [Allacma fusca]
MANAKLLQWSYW